MSGDLLNTVKCSCLLEKAKHLHESLFAASSKLCDCACVLIYMKLKMAEVDSDRPDSSLLNTVQKLLRPVSEPHIHNLYSNG